MGTEEWSEDTNFVPSDKHLGIRIAEETSDVGYERIELVKKEIQNEEGKN